MTGEQTEVVPYLTSAILIYFAQKFLKGRPAYATFVTAMPGAAKWAHWLVAGVGATFAALGIHVTSTWTASDGGHIQFAVPGLWAMLHAAWDWIRVFALQQFAYEATRRDARQP